MSEIHWNFFDANCVVGRHLRLQADGLHTADELLAEMDHYDVAEALVVDALSRENHPFEGNRRIVEVTAGRPRLRPAWVALPPGTDEQPAPAELLAQMRRHRVGALYLYTGQYRFNLADWCVDDLMAPLAEAGVPVFVCPDEFGPPWSCSDLTNWNEIVGLCRRWPQLPVIVTEFRVRRLQRQGYRALDACPNLRIELSGWWLHHGIEYITRRWGSGRLVFGSNWPRLGQHQTLATLACAEIDDADKRKIAGDNLRQLISWCEPPTAQHKSQPPADRYVEFGRTGQRPAGMVFHDCHGHLGEHAAHYHLPDCDLDGIVREMDRLGTQKICAFSFSGVYGDEAVGNDYVAEAVRRYPEKFVGFTLLNPHRGRDAMLRELERGAQRGLRGIKLIPYYQGYPEEGPLLEVACQWAHERRQIILDHSWGSPAHLERLAAAYPQACFVTGHSTGAYAEIMKRYANIHVGSCPLLGPRDCETLVGQIGADRLLFGSDLEDLPIAWGLGPILFARLPVAAKELILGGNLQRILKTHSLKP